MIPALFNQVYVGSDLNCLIISLKYPKIAVSAAESPFSEVIQEGLNVE